MKIELFSDVVEINDKYAPLPCPCCGEVRAYGFNTKRNKSFGIDVGRTGNGFEVHCYSCGLRMIKPMPDRYPKGVPNHKALLKHMMTEALKAWNKRAKKMLLPQIHNATVVLDKFKIHGVIPFLNWSSPNGVHDVYIKHKFIEIQFAFNSVQVWINGVFFGLFGINDELLDRIILVACYKNRYGTK